MSLSQEKNRYKVLEFIAKQKGFEIDKDSSASSFLAEVPIFSKNDTRRFIVDGIIDLYNTKHSNPLDTTIGQPYKNGLIMKSFSGKELHLMRGAIYRKIVYDIKPRLDSVSSALGQLKTYSHFLTYVRYYNGQKST